MRFALLFLLLLMLVACGKLNSSNPSVPAIQKVDCWFDPIDNISSASCYQVYVYENHADTASSIISFPLVKLTAEFDKNKPKKTPLIDFGGGGPGGESGIGEDDIAWLVDIYRPFSLDQGRDLYLFEVRGTGLASPKLMCDSQLSTAQKLWTSNLSNEQRDQYDFDTFMSCIDELRTKSIKL